MSYCRWSTDCYKSNVYVYKNGPGYIIHVAENRYVGDVSRPNLDRELESGGTRAVQDYFRKCDAWARSAHLEPIDLPEHGKTFCLPTPGECAEKLEYLRGLGYYVPQGAIDELKEEMK